MTALHSVSSLPLGKFSPSYLRTKIQVKLSFLRVTEPETKRLHTQTHIVKVDCSIGRIVRKRRLSECQLGKPPCPLSHATAHILRHYFWLDQNRSRLAKRLDRKEVAFGNVGKYSPDVWSKHSRISTVKPKWIVKVSELIRLTLL